MRARRSAAVQEPRTPAAGGTPWKGRLRSQPAIPQSAPTPRLPSLTKNREETRDVQSSKKRAAFQNKRRGCNTEAPRRRSPRLTGSGPEHPIVIDEVGEEYNGRDNQLEIKPLRRSPRLTGSDPAHPSVIDEVGEECKGRDNQPEIKPLRSSPRLQAENKNLLEQIVPPDLRETPHNRKTEKALSRKDESQKSRKKNKRNAKIKSLKESQEPCQGPEGIPPRNKVADVSNKKSGKQEVKPSHCEVLTRKRNRDTREKSSKRKWCQDPKSLPSGCKEIVPSNEPRKSIDTKIEKVPSIIRHPKVDYERSINFDEINKEASEIKREQREHCCGSDDWTEEQDIALRNAYFTARPSPHFWKKISKMVPGKSAEECFNRIYADLSTPTPIAARPRTSKTFSPLGKFTLSDAELPNILKPTVISRRTAKQKCLAAQKTVRHLLQKNRLIDQAQEADHFSIFETSPSATKLNIFLEDSLGTPDGNMNSGSLSKCSGSSSSRKKPLSRLRTKQAEPSPAVLKPIKNVVLHERYINQLSRREIVKGSRKRNSVSKAFDYEKTFPEKQGDGLKAAKDALVSEATDFIGRFKKFQANSHAHIVENSEDDEADFRI